MCDMDTATPVKSACHSSMAIRFTSTLFVSLAHGGGALKFGGCCIGGIIGLFVTSLTLVEMTEVLLYRIIKI